MTAARSSQPPVPGSALASRDHDSLPVGVEMTAVAAAAQMKATVAARYLVAFERPRDWEKVERQLMAACDRPAFAEEGMYLLEKSGAKIEGLSTRFAEESARWVGNLMAEAIVTYDDENQRTVRVIVTDLEANVTYPTDVVVQKTVERRSSAGREVVSRRVNSQNQPVYQVRATDDEIMVKQNSLVSKARRNEILRLLPADLQEQAKARIRQTLEKASRSEAAIPSMLQAFAGIEVDADMLRNYLGHPVEATTPAELVTLRGLYQAVKDGETTWEEISKGKGKHQTKARGEPGINSSGYAEPVKPEVKTMAGRPTGKGPLPSDPYLQGKDAPEPQEPGAGLTDEEELALDRELRDQEG